MNEHFIDTLCKLGLTSYQAKVYFAILSKTKMKVPEIADLTGIHEQDVYKILPRLEQIGLIAKTATKPLTLEALAPEITLKELIKSHQEELDNAKKKTNEMINLIKNKKQGSIDEKLKEKVLIFKTFRNFDNFQILSRKGNRRTLDLMGEREHENEYLKLTLPYFEEDKKTMARNHVKVRILCRYRATENRLSREDLNHFSKFNFDIEIKTVKYSIKDFFLPDYLIRDNEELWIKTDKNIFQGINTDCIAIVKLAQDHFEKFWQDSTAELVFSSGGSKL